jgi:peptidoglycan/LPS O-acetylase OafA/YrhL
MLNAATKPMVTMTGRRLPSLAAKADRLPLSVLTSLRFFAAAEVVFFHFFHYQQLDFVHNLMSGGRQAVTFFFVLSGFILTYVYSGHRVSGGITVSAKEFWKARFGRIMPAYWLGLLVAAPAFTYSALISRMSPLGDFVQGLILCPLTLQAWWPPAALAWNPPAWSLSVEMFFYLLFPPLAHAAARLSVNQLLLVALGLVLGTAALVQTIMPGPDTPALVWNPILFNPLFHLPQFLLGMTIARIFLFKTRLSTSSHLLLFVGGSFAAILIIGARASLPWWISSNAILAPMFGLVVFGAARATGTVKALVVPPMLTLGEASYSLYILHWPLLFWWDWIQHKILQITLPEFVSFSVYFLICLTSSLASFLWVERPLRRWILGHRPHSDRLAPITTS